MFDGLLDVWTVGHVLFGVVAALLRFRFPTMLALAWAWEWFEAAGFGLCGEDPSPWNSVLDVLAASLAFLSVNLLARVSRHKALPMLRYLSHLRDR